jgi:hypothetical protein
MAFDAVGDFRQVFARVLQEVGRGSVCFESSIVFVLLINEKSTRIGPVPMYLKH